MATVVYGATALANLERIFEFLAQHDPIAAAESVQAIRSAVGTLAEHPFIGRRRSGDLRELVIAYGKSGYVALYRFIPLLGEVRVLAIRHQRELDYPL